MSAAHRTEGRGHTQPTRHSHSPLCRAWVVEQSVAGWRGRRRLGRWCACDDGTVVCADRSRVPWQLPPSCPGPAQHQAVKYCHRGPSSAFSGSQRRRQAGACRSDLLGGARAGMRRALTRGRNSPNNTKGIRNAASRSAGARASHVTEDSAEHSPRLARPGFSPCLLPKAAPQPPSLPLCARSWVGQGQSSRSALWGPRSD